MNNNNNPAVGIHLVMVAGLSNPAQTSAWMKPRAKRFLHLLKDQPYVQHLTTKPREERATSELSRQDGKQGHGNNPYD